jgi:MFS family permease
VRSPSPFRALWGANALSNLADGLVFVTMPLVAAGLTDDPRGVAGLATTYALVRLLVALPVGVYVDRLDRRTLIVVANALRGVAVLGLAVSIQSGIASLAVLYAVMAVVGVLESAADGAAVAVLPSIVPRDRLDRANARITGTQLVADEFVGPPLGGILFALAAAVPVYATGGLWVAAGAVALALPRRVDPAASLPGSRPSVFREAAAGVRWLAGHRVVGSLALIGGLASVGYMLPFSVLVLFAGERLGLDAAGYGVLLAASALGGLAGSAIAAPLRARLGSRGTITAALALGAVMVPREPRRACCSRSTSCMPRSGASARPRCASGSCPRSSSGAWARRAGWSACSASRRDPRWAACSRPRGSRSRRSRERSSSRDARCSRSWRCADPSTGIRRPSPRSAAAPPRAPR